MAGAGFPEWKKWHGSYSKNSPAPLLRVSFRRERHWQIAYIKAPPLNRLDSDSVQFLAEAFSLYQTKRWRQRPSRPPARYDLAILHNPTDTQPPSDPKALRNFIRAGTAAGVAVELIERKDFARMAEYDALFIRDTMRKPLHLSVRQKSRE